MKVKKVLEVLLAQLEGSQAMRQGHPVIYLDVPLDYAQILKRFLRRCLDPEYRNPGETIDGVLETD